MVHAWDSANAPLGAGTMEQMEAKQRKLIEAHPRPCPALPTTVSADKRPAPYPQNLTPTPSDLCPHCLAKDRLRLWLPPPNCPTTVTSLALNGEEQERVKDTMVHAWEEETGMSYGSSLLMWHCFCNAKEIPELERAPATQGLLSAFIAYLAAVYSGHTIACYLNGVRGWHILHSIPWALKKREMDTMLHAADKLTPVSSRRKKRLPYTPAFILGV